MNSIEIKNHIKVNQILNKIKDDAFKLIASNHSITEYEVQRFIIKEYKKYYLKQSKDPPIVAFNQSSCEPHYYPKKDSKKLKPNTMIMIDIWARLNKKHSPFGDITWMGYYGKVPKEIQNVFNVIKKSRDASINYIKKELKKGKLPIGREVNEVSKQVIIEAGYEKNIRHSVGHSIGVSTSPHGIYGHVNRKNKNPLKINMLYTIEPGIYFKNKYGIRSEIDFYINNKRKVIITTKVQKKLIII